MKTLFLLLALCLPASAAQDMEAMMKAAAQAGAPNENHKRLEPFVGKWKASSKMWMKPGDKPMESTGENTFTWTMGGRFLKQDFAGDMGGQKFEGMGYLGYDNIRKEYQNVWLDSMSTHIMSTSGKYDAAKKAIVDTGTFSCPMTGDKNRYYRGEMKLPEGDTFTFTMYSKEGGKEFKTMEIVYTRLAKAS